jgi:hypothetical protein
MRMGGLELFGQAQDVIVRAANDAVTADFDAVGGGNTHGDGIGVDIHADEQNEARVCGKRSAQSGRGGGGSCARRGEVLVLDSLGVAE